MPVNGHTPSVSVSGSDEKRAEHREPQRQVRRRCCSLEPELLSSGFTGWQRQRDSGKTGCAELLTGISFCEWLRERSCILWRCCATGFVSAATWLTSLLTWRVGEDARSRGEARRSHEKRGSHRHRDYDPAQHRFPYNTI